MSVLGWFIYAAVGLFLSYVVFDHRGEYGEDERTIGSVLFFAAIWPLSLFIALVAFVFGRRI